MRRLSFLGLVAASTLLAPALTHAQAIVYAPVSAVPTLGEWATLGLAVAVAFAGLVMARRMGSRVMMALALGAAAALTAGSGSLLGKAYAISGEFMTLSTGGTIDLSGYGTGVDIRIYGNATKPMRILSVTPPSAPTTGQPTCVAGMIVEPSDTDAAAAPSGGSSAGSSICYYRKSGPI